MYASFIELLDSMQNEFKKFENSKTVSNKYRDIIDKKSDSIRQFFINCLKHTDTGIMSIFIFSKKDSI